MAYNFPVNYQPQMYYPQYPSSNQPQAQSAQPASSSIIWVQGEAGAKSYLVAPNTTVQLWDSEQPTIYLKSADASGMPSIKVLDYTIRAEGSRSSLEALKNDEDIKISREDLNALQEQIDALKDELGKCKKALAAKAKTKEVSE